eukprot:CAMPEP_0197444706 /NCGR_PEP_ID=MMETSP1175-20131217/10128_1 /TAXON_ID=1003142 /ORGANISM="Triceratium dubium, Strain CCMP147" /LENGTH=229 /DNA_ID=CAMNT_0042975545 /DNA_START=203 /DNA_END=892 /DNA_ORIENTATION=+
MSKPPLKNVAEEALKALPDGGTREVLAQSVSDFAVGCDITPTLSERLTTRYMYDNMGILDGPDESDWEILDEVEAYNVVFADEDAEFVVDRRSIFDPKENKESYKQENDELLINSAIQAWFKKNVFMKGRAPGSDTAIVDKTVGNIKKEYGIGECLKYGLLHSCSGVPDGKRNKRMYLEFYAELLNVPCADDRSYPYYHLWEHGELRFRMCAITYSNKTYLTVHMPGYG